MSDGSSSLVDLGGMDDNDKLLTIPQIADLTVQKHLGRNGYGLTVNTLYTYNAGRGAVRDRKMPVPDTYEGTTPKWRESTILRWFDEREEGKRVEAEVRRKYWKTRKG